MTPAPHDKADPTPEVNPNEPHAYAALVGGDPIVVPDTTVVQEPADQGERGAGYKPGADDGRAPEPPPPVSPARANVVIIALATAAFLVVSNEISIMGLLTPMSTSLGRSEADIGLASTVFAVSVMVFTLPLTLLTTRFVRRWVIVGAIGLFAVGTFVAATADTFGQLLVSRGITGAAHALFWAVVTPAAAGMFPLARRGKSVARLLLGASAAGVVGLPAETYLGQQVGWHAPFWVLTAAGALLCMVVAVLMPSFRTQQSTMVRGEFPSVKRFARVMAVTALSTCAMSATWTFFSPMVTEHFGFSDGSVSILLVVGGASGVVTTWLIARYLDRWPVKSVVVGEALLLVMFVGLALSGGNKVVLIAMLLLQGVAWSVLVVAMINWALRHSPWTSDIGNGVYAVLFNTGNAVGSRLGVAMVAAWGVEWMPLASVAFVAGALAFAVTTPHVRLLRRGRGLGAARG